MSLRSRHLSRCDVVTTVFSCLFLTSLTPSEEVAGRSGREALQRGLRLKVAADSGMIQFRRTVLNYLVSDLGQELLSHYLVS